MRKAISLLAALVATVALASGCADTGGWNTGDTGALLGGVVGGVAGHQVGGGRGKTIATVAGAVVGSMVGRRLGQRMSNQDRRQFGNTLATNSTGQTSSWNSGSTNDYYEVTPTSDTYYSNNRTCREFTMQARVDGQPDQVRGTACQQADGSWVVQ